jgi:3-oxoacyl-[acyl-carrier-protein] synthase-1
LKEVFLISDNIISSLGFTTEENMASIRAGHTGIKPYTDASLAPAPFWASRIDDVNLQDRFAAYGDPAAYTRFEQLVICSVKDALSRSHVDITEKMFSYLPPKAISIF